MTDAILPRAEIANLLTAVFEAGDPAVEGLVAEVMRCSSSASGGHWRARRTSSRQRGSSLVAEGYEVLFIGKQRALEGEANVEPTADAVEEAWDGAIRRYARRRGIGRA
jgi:hypothetical protein